MLIDIHSYKENKSHQQVLSYFYGQTPTIETFFTIGAHPWDLANFDISSFKNKTSQFKEHKNFFGIGEIGLDRTKGIELNLQKDIFKTIIQYAKDENIKRLIIHCVKAYEEVIFCIKESKYQGQIIFHDFNASFDIIKKLLEYDVYFSFGANILRENSKAQKYIQKIPHNKVFFESDDKESLEKVYYKAHELTGIDFTKICQENFKKLF